MILGPWFHGPTTVQRTRFGDFDFGPDAGVDFNSLRLPWFDHWLKGMDTVSDWPAVRYFTMGLNEWQTAEAWPPTDSESLDLYLSQGPCDTADSLNDGRLTEGPPSDGNADRYVYDPADPVRALGGSMIGYPWHGPEYEGFSGPFDQRPVEPRCLTYTGAPLERDVEASGPVRATPVCVVLCARYGLGRPTLRRLTRWHCPASGRGHPQGQVPRFVRCATPHGARRGLRSSGRSVVNEQSVPAWSSHPGSGHQQLVSEVGQESQHRGSVRNRS